MQDVEIGDYISMIPTSTSYTPPSELTGCMNDSNCTQNTLNPSELNLWRIIRKNEDGTVDAVSEYVSSTVVYFRGQTGYLNLVGGLNTISAQYTNEKYVSKTRHIGYSNQTEILTNTNKLVQTSAPWIKPTSKYNQWTGCDTNSYLCGIDELLGAGDIGYIEDYNLVNGVYGNMIGYTSNKAEIVSYILASRIFAYQHSKNWNFGFRIVGDDGGISYANLYYWYHTEFVMEGYPFAVRPILTLKADIRIKNGDGKSSSTAYKFE